MRGMHPHHQPPQWPQWPPQNAQQQPPPDTGRELKKGIIWGTSIMTLGPIIAFVVLTALCCGGCIVMAAIGEAGNGTTH